MKKISRREFLAVSAAVGVTGLLSACGGDSSNVVASSASSDAASTPVTLIYNEVNPETSLSGRVAAYFAEQAHALSDGMVTIDVRANGSLLDNEGDVLTDMTGPAPTVDIARVAMFQLDNYNVPSTRLCSLPFLFQDRDHFWNFAQDDLGKTILTDCKTVGGLGIEGKCYFEEGFRHFFFSKEVHGLADLAGLNIRVSNSSLYGELVKSLGANPVDISFSQLYPSLGRVCDGAEQPIVNYQSNNFYEPAPYMILDGHGIASAMLVVTDSAWSKLDASQQKAVQTAFDATAAYNKELSATAEQDSRKICEDAGVIFVPVEDLTPWKQACAQLIRDNTADQEELYNAILELA